MRILAISDDPMPVWNDDAVLAVGAIGEIAVSGDVVTHDYANRPEATAAAKIHGVDASGAELIWHRMGDLGYLDDSGQLWFCGRKSERVETATGPLYTDCVEGQLAPLCAGRRIALVGLGVRGSERPAICVEGVSDVTITEALKKSGFTSFFKPVFPVDVRHNAKIHRLQLKAWAETQTALE